MTEKGDGCIQQLGRNKWRVSVSFGRDPVTGKYRRTTKVVNGTKADARRVRDEIRQTIESGVLPDAGKTTFGEFSKVWLERRIESGEYADNTIKHDRNDLRNINRYLRDVPLAEITPMTADNLYSALRNERGLSGTSLNSIHKTLQAVMGLAVRYNMVTRNPCDKYGAKAPKRSDNDRRSLSREECIRLLSAINDEESAALADRVNVVPSMSCLSAARIGLATGARRGEVLALTWGKVDFETAMLEISASIDPAMKVTKPKGKTIRNVVLDDATIEALAAWKSVQRRELLSVGIEQGTDTPICSNGIGAYMNPNNFSRWWRRFTSEHGFKGLRFHELRHSMATLLLGNGLDVESVSRRLGHADASITLKLYTHSIRENDRRAANLVGELFSNCTREDSEETLKKGV